MVWKARITAKIYPAKLYMPLGESLYRSTVDIKVNMITLAQREKLERVYGCFEMPSAIIHHPYTFSSVFSSSQNC